MLTTDYTSKLLDLQDVQVEKVENLGEKKQIYIKLERKVVNCPCCHEETSKIHDYRMRQVTWAFDAIRKEEQKHLRADVRKHFKRSRSLLLKRYDLLTPEERQAVDTMLWYSVRLREAHTIKEWFYKIIDTKNVCERKEKFKAPPHNRAIK